MTPVTLVVVAVALAWQACGIAQYLAEQKQLTPEAAFRDVMAVLRSLSKSLKFVSEQNGTFLFQPKGNYRGVTYDGTIATRVTPIAGTRSFYIVTWMLRGNQWVAVERLAIDAAKLRSQLAGHTGTAIGIPQDLRRQLANSTVHRNTVCGITTEPAQTTAPAR